MVQPDSPLMAI